MKIDTQKAIKFLLEKIYESEFQVIDGFNQHCEGLNFEEWLKEKDLIAKSTVKQF